MSTFYIPNNPLSKQVALQEAMHEGLNERLGITEKEQENVRAFHHAQHSDQAPTLQRGVAGDFRVHGETFKGVEEHTNGHGERVVTVTRALGGGRFETRRIVEAQAGRHTRVVSDVKGSR